MRTSSPSKLPIFRSRLQADLLALLFLSGDQGLAVKDLAERTAASRSSIQRELARLLDAGILERQEIGRTSVYRPAESPVSGPLAALIAVTVGVVPRLTEQLARLTGIEVAVVYGSWASGPVSPDSDIDLLVIGSIDYADLVREVAKVEQAVGREIDVRLYAEEDFDSKLGEASGFLRTALSGPTRTLVGELPELPR